MRRCKVCVHVDRESVERDLIASRGSFRDIARQYGLTKDSIARHSADHLPTALVKSQNAVNVVRADNLLAEVDSGINRTENLYDLTRAVLQRACRSNDTKMVLNAVKTIATVERERRAYLELRNRMSSEMLAADRIDPLSPINRVDRLLVMNFPKTPDAAAIDRARLGLPPLADGEVKSSGHG